MSLFSFSFYRKWLKKLKSDVQNCLPLEIHYKCICLYKYTTIYIYIAKKDLSYIWPVFKQRSLEITTSYNWNSQLLLDTNINIKKTEKGLKSKGLKFLNNSEIKGTIFTQNSPVSFGFMIATKNL